jgi:PIN domain nuclease of toxin-antitoxin system
MPTILLDSHVLEWWSSASGRLTRAAERAIEDADAHVVSSITWYELGWLAHHGRIPIPLPVRAWLEALSARVETASISPAIAATAVALPDSFPRDPADRIIYATAIENGWPLVTRDRSMRAHRQAATIW